MSMSSACEGVVAGLAVAVLAVPAAVAAQSPQEGLLETFPEPPDGWTARPAVDRMAGATSDMGLLLQRVYEQKGADGMIDATLAIDNPMLAGMGEAIEDPSMLEADPHAELVEIGDERALLRWEEDARLAELSLVLDDGIVVRIDGMRLESPDPVLQIARDWDAAAVRAHAER